MINGTLSLGFFKIRLLLGRFEDSPDYFLCYLSTINTFNFYIEILNFAFGIRFSLIKEDKK